MRSNLPARGARALDGGPHDPLQHGDRGRRQPRMRPPTRHLRLSQGPADRAKRRALDEGDQDWAAAVRPRRAFDARSPRRGALAPSVTWGTTPESRADRRDEFPIRPMSPMPAGTARCGARWTIWAGARGRTDEIEIERVFIGSCTNGGSRICARRRAVVRAERCTPSVPAHGVAGPAWSSGRPRRKGSTNFRVGRLRMARIRLLDVRGHERRRLPPGERCASTTNRNFEGRQGRARAPI